jgi:hypothetical protein
MYGSDREGMRRVFVEAFRKAEEGRPLEPLERRVAEVAGLHPEYHALLRRGDGALGRDFPPELGQTNPFLHMGLHIGLREQLATDRPAGIAALYRGICLRTGDVHAAEHLMMECLAQSLWEAQRAGALPDEARYLDCLRSLAGPATAGKP